MRSGTDVGQEGLAHSLHSSSYQKVFDRIEVRALCRPVKLFMDLALCTGAQSCWNKKGLPQTVSTTLEVVLSKMAWHTEALRSPFTGSKGPSTNPEKQPLYHYPSSTKPHSWHNAGQLGNVLLASTKPRLTPLTAKQRSMICGSTEHISIAPQSSGGILYTAPHDALHWTWWYEACMQLLDHRNPFREAPATVFVLALVPVEVQKFKFYLVLS